MNGLVMVEGLPGSGKSTTAHGIAAWLVEQQVPAEHWAEGRVDHPVDFRASGSDAVIDYHCGQGLGLRHGLGGFDGYVEFMRRRREMELAVLDAPDLPMLVVPVGDGQWEEHTATIRAFVAGHVVCWFEAHPAAGGDRFPVFGAFPQGCRNLPVHDQLRGISCASIRRKVSIETTDCTAPPRYSSRGNAPCGMSTLKPSPATRAGRSTRNTRRSTSAARTFPRT